jgi:repressor LexA
MEHPPLTRRQHEILEFMGRFTVLHGISPTLEEIAQELGVNKVTVFGHVAELERKGVLARAGRGISRGLQIVPGVTKPNTRVAILGRIAAGKPVEAVESNEDFDLQDLLPRGKDTYALRVNGQSMIEDSICDGDIVLVERRSNPRNGETVVAVLPGESATLKRFYREGKRIRLQPANESMAPIFVDDVDVRGVVVGILRKF